MYIDAAGADVSGLTCIDHTFQYDFSSGSTYQLRCLNGGVTPIKYPSVPRPPGCFVEELIGSGETIKPTDYNPYVSEYMDCKRSGLTSACGAPTPGLDYSQAYVRTWANIADGPVYIQTNSQSVKIVAKILTASGITRVLSKDYVLIEIERNATSIILRVDDEEIVAQPISVLGVTIVDGLSHRFVHSRSASSKDCAERHDQVSDYTDLFIFTGQHVDCSEYDSVDKLAYCMLRTNKPECGAADLSWSTAQPLLTVDQTSACFDLLEPWSECSSACMDKIYEPVPCSGEGDCPGFDASSLFRFCSSQNSFSAGRVPASIATSPACMVGGCINTLGDTSTVTNAILESFCDDYLKEDGKCTSLTCSCESGYGGDRCEVVCPIGNGKTCSGNGECIVPNNHPCSGLDRCPADIFGSCKCEEGSGSACTIECQDCSFAPYTKRQSQRGACNSEFGVCEVLPPGMIFDYEGAREEGKTVSAVPFNRDGSVADTSDFDVMSVADILSQVRLNNCGNGVPEDLTTEKQGTTTKTKKQLLDAMESHPSALPYDYLQAPEGYATPSAPNSWNEISGCYSLPDAGASCSGKSKSQCDGDCRWYTIPVSLNTSMATFLSTYTFERTLVEQECVAYPMVKKVLQMQSRFEMAPLLEFYSASPNWSAGAAVNLNKALKERVADPERSAVAGYDITITLSAEVTVENGEVYPDPVYVIDAIRTDSDVEAGVLNVTVDTDFYEIPITGERSRTFVRGCMDSIFGLERQCNDGISSAVYYRVEPVSADIDDTIFMHFDKEMVFSGIYSGGSGICGLSSELTCPGASTEFNVPCSGHGTCTRSSCQCTCDITPEKAAEPGVILNMQQFLDHSPYRGRGCETTCPGYDGFSMDSVCSGRGVCNYRGKCQCEEQYRGDNCEYTCPLLVNADGSESSVCNGHGICEVQSFDLSSLQHEHTGVPNYEPADLPAVGDPVKTVEFTFEKGIDAHESGTVKHDPTPPEYSVHMTCIRLDADTLQCAGCVCDSSNVNRRGSWAGAVCSQCASTAYGPRCMSQCPDCAGYGICDFGLTGSGECLCGDTEWGGIVRKNSDDDNRVRYHYVRDNTIHIRRSGATFEQLITAGPSFKFEPGSNCRACIKGFDGGDLNLFYRNTCSGQPVPCLMGGEIVSLPSTEDQCICKNGLFDPENHCCPHGWAVPTNIADDFETMFDASLYNMQQLIGLDGASRVCYPCPNDDPDWDLTTSSGEIDAMRSALAFSATVCGGSTLTPCKAQSSGGGVAPTLCDCPEINGVTISSSNCDSEVFANLFGTCSGGRSWGCGGVCGADLECTSCEVGKYMDETSHRSDCKVCPSGYVTQEVILTNQGVSDVDPRPYLTLVGSVHFAACLYCAPGWVGEEPESFSDAYTPMAVTADCGKCQLGTQEASDGSAECTLCQPGQYGRSTLTFSEYNTNANPYVINGVEHHANYCAACRTGQYQNEAGKFGCKTCPVGRYQDEATGAGACKICPVGYYRQTTGGTACDFCSPGEYQDQNGQTSCKDCPVAKFQDFGGQTSCKNCPTGKYQNQNGASSCTDCEKGQYQDQSAKTSCKNCPNGQYQDQTGKTGCKECGNCMNTNTYRCTFIGTNGLCINGCQGCLGL
jgi:hypothetical protein